MDQSRQANLQALEEQRNKPSEAQAFEALYSEFRKQNKQDKKTW